jgi:hypothetical protein
VIYFQKTKMGKKNRITIELETKSVRENARLLVPPASRCRHRAQASRIPSRSWGRNQEEVYQEGEAMHEQQQKQQRLQESPRGQVGTKPEGSKYPMG